MVAEKNAVISAVRIVPKKLINIFTIKKFIIKRGIVALTYALSELLFIFVWKTHKVIMLNLKKWVIISEKRIAYLGLTTVEVNIKRDGPITVNIEPEIRYLIWEDLYKLIILDFKFKNNTKYYLHYYK